MAHSERAFLCLCEFGLSLPAFMTWLTLDTLAVIRDQKYF